MPLGRWVLGVGSLFLVAAAGCGGSAPEEKPAPTAAAQEWFVDVAKQSGLDFVHFNGMTGEFYYPEVMAPGVALFDYDGDGDLDVFIPQGHVLGGKPADQALQTPPADLRGRLFRNDLSNSTLRFTDVTAASGIDARGYGMGAAAGDYNNDGCVDLYLTNLGANQFYRNNCNGTFTDVTKASGAGDEAWSVSAAFVDYDRDGWLDLFVGNYLNYAIASNIKCYSLSGQSDYCPPHVYRPQPSRLYRNNGNGTFSDRTAAAGMSSEFGPAQGISTADFNRDGWIDIYVANDGAPNNLWINQQNGTFHNTALLAGVAVSPEGLAKASMGVDAGDFDNDGDEDIFIGELTGQGADLYVNDGGGVFTDDTARSGLRVLTLPYTGFGAAWLDYDNDGLLDVAMVNGAVTHTAEALARNEKFALGQREQLYRNVGGGRFENVSDRAGAAFRAEDVSRGAAFGDLDNDGDADIVVANDAGPVRLLINSVGNRKHWVGLRLLASGGKRDALGARVAITRADGSVLWRRARADGSYASANDPRVLAGLGDSTRPPNVRVAWPSGRTEEWPSVAVDRYTALVEGTGTAVSR